MNFIGKLLSDNEPLSSQLACGCLLMAVAAFVWAVVNLWLVFSGKSFAYYEGFSATCLLVIGWGRAYLVTTGI